MELKDFMEIKSEPLRILEVATQVQKNAEAEAEAVQDYTEFKQFVEVANFVEKDKKHITEVIDEIIADELNHQIKLRELYTLLTDIKPNKD